MTRKFLRSKIHRAIVTSCDVDYEGSMSLPIAMMSLAQILPYEAISVWNVTNGNRFETYAIEGVPGEICVNGAAAHLVDPGDTVIVSTYNYLEVDEVPRVEPVVVLVDGDNAAFHLKQKAAARAKVDSAHGRLV